MWLFDGLPTAAWASIIYRTGLSESSASPAIAGGMRAVVYDRYGPPEVLRVWRSARAMRYAAGMGWDRRCSSCGRFVTASDDDQLDEDEGTVLCATRADCARRATVRTVHLGTVSGEILGLRLAPHVVGVVKRQPGRASARPRMVTWPGSEDLLTA